MNPSVDILSHMPIELLLKVFDIDNEVDVYDSYKGCAHHCFIYNDENLLDRGDEFVHNVYDHVDFCCLVFQENLKYATDFYDCIDTNILLAKVNNLIRYAMTSKMNLDTSKKIFRELFFDSMIERCDCMYGILKWGAIETTEDLKMKSFLQVKTELLTIDYNCSSIVDIMRRYAYQDPIDAVDFLMEIPELIEMYNYDYSFLEKRSRYIKSIRYKIISFADSDIISSYDTAITLKGVQDGESLKIDSVENGFGYVSSYFDIDL